MRSGRVADLDVLTVGGYNEAEWNSIPVYHEQNLDDRGL